MKKLTAGIFTVMLGLVAVDANAQIATDAWVNNQISIEADARTAADTKLREDKQDKLTQANAGGTHITIGADGKINVNTGTGGVATQAGLDELQGTVEELSGLVGDTNVADTIAQYAKKDGDFVTAVSEANKGLTQNDAYTKTEADGRFDAKGAAAAAQNAAEAKVTELANGQVKTNTDNIAAINNPTTGAVATSKAYTDTKVGALPNGMTDVAAAVADAKKAGTDAQADLDAYKITNDAAVKANTDAIASFTDETSGIAATYETKADAQNSHDTLNAAISAEKIRAEAAEQTNASSITALSDSFNGAISEDGTYVLTVKKVGETRTFYWENITGRGGN